MTDNNVINRRRFLQLCGGSAAGLFLPAVRANVVTQPDRVLSLYNTHTGERLKRTYWSQGVYIREHIKEIEWLLRDHRQHLSHVYDLKIFDMLYQLQHLIGTRKPFHVISGYRTPETNAMLFRTTSGVDKKSFHMSGRAIDIRVPRYDIARLHKAALSLQAGGVGYYPRSNFIHLDTGKVRSW